MPVSNEHNIFKVNVQKNPDGSLKVEFTQSCPPSAPIKFKQTLGLNAQGEFAATNTIRPGNPMQITGKNSVLLKFPGLTEPLIIKPDGSLVLGKMQSAAEIRLNTYGNIVVDGDLALKALKLQGSTIKLHQPIEAEKITLQAENQLNNHKSLKAQNIQISGNGCFTNLGVANASENLKMSIRAINNKGELTAKNLLTQIHAAHISPAPSDRKEPWIYFKNSGVIYGAEKLSLHIPGALVNEESGSVLSKQKIFVKVHQLKNKGKFFSESELFADGIAYCENTGLMHANQDAMVASANKINNTGTFESVGSLKVSSNDELHNSATGKMLANTLLEVQSTKAFSNDGVMKGLYQVNIGANAPIVNSETGQILSNADVKISGLGVLKNDGIVTGHNSVTTINMGNTSNSEKAEIRGGNVSVTSLDEMSNKHIVAAQNKLAVKAKSLLNHASGQFLGETATFAAENMQNGGVLEAVKSLNIDTFKEFKNLKDASVSAINIHVKSETTQNEGKIEAEAALTIETRRLLDNLLTGFLFAGKKLEVASQESFNNSGTVQSNGSLKIDVMDFLRNLKDGKMIAATNLQLIANQLISNAGRIQSAKDISIKIGLLLQTLANSQITAEERLNVVSQFCMEHAGLMEGNHIHVDVVGKLTQHKESETHAGTQLAMQGNNLSLAGVSKSDGSITTQSDRLQITETGKLLAQETLTSNVKEDLDNVGVMQGKKVKVKAGSIHNRGSIASLETLSLTVKATLQHCKEGRISAGQAIEILAKDLQWLGQTMVKGDFTATITQGFEYSTEALWAAGLIKLMLKNNYDFTKPIHTPGNMKIESSSDVTVSTSVQVGQDFSAKAQNVTVQKKGVFAGGSLSVEAEKTAQLGQAVFNGSQYVSDGAYLTANGKISMQGNVVRNALGEIYTTDDLLLHALQLIENTGNINVEKNATVIAPLFQHKLMTRRYAQGNYHTITEAQSAKPTITVGGDCTLNTNTEILGGDLHTGGKLKLQGEFHAHSFEAFQAWQEEHTQVIRGERRYLGLFGPREKEYVMQWIPHHKTNAVYASQVSSGTKIEFQGKKFSNGGVVRTSEFEAEFVSFLNDGNVPNLPSSQTVDIPLTDFFKENAIFGRVQDDFYLYGAKLPLKDNLQLPPKVLLGDCSPRAKVLLSPIAEKQALQKAIQKELRSGYIDSSATNINAILTQLHYNAYAFFQQCHSTLETADGHFEVKIVAGNGNCMFESCLLAIKAALKHLPSHPIHAVADHAALRKLIVADLSGRFDDIVARVQEAIMDETLEALDFLPPGAFKDEVRAKALRYHSTRALLGENAANAIIKEYLDSVPARYITHMSTLGTWGGDLELGEIAKKFGVNIVVNKVVETSSGFEYQESLRKIGDNPQHPLVNVMYTGNHYNALAPISEPVGITEADLAHSKVALIYYKQKIIAGQPVLEPRLWLPQNVRNIANMNTVHQGVIRVEKAVLKGGQGSLFANRGGLVRGDGAIAIIADAVSNQQKTRTVHTLQTVSRLNGDRFVETQEAVPGGVIEADKLTIKTLAYDQIGGALRSGAGGTELESRDKASVQALPTSAAVQKEITRRGQNYEIQPDFVKAELSSGGNQRVEVTNGTFQAQGMDSKAEGENTIIAKGVDVQHSYSTFDQASQHTHKKKTGGTGFAALPSVIQGGKVDIISSEHVSLIYTHLLSEGDVSLKARTFVDLLNGIGESSAYQETKKLKGFTYTTQEAHESEKHVLRSRCTVLGNLHIEAGERARLTAVKGFVLGNMTVEALNVYIDGAQREKTTMVKTKTYGISFFGSEAISSVMQGKGKEALDKLLANESFTNALKTLVQAKKRGEQCIEATRTFLEGWRLAVTVAQGIEGKDLSGALTDRVGLTTTYKDEQGKTQRKFNPNITFSFNQSTARSHESQTVSSQFTIGGDLTVKGDNIYLLDGTQIEAFNIKLIAEKLLKITTAKDTHKTKQTSEGGTLSVRADGTFAGASANASHQESATVQYQNATIKAKNLLSLLSEKGSVVVQGGELQGKDVIVKALKVIVESLQDTHDAERHSVGVSVDADGGLNGMQYGESSAERRWVNHHSRIEALQSLEVLTDYLHQKGAVLSANASAQIQALTPEKPMVWEAEDIQDYEENHSIDVGLNINSNDSFPVTGSVLVNQSHKVGVTRATVFAPALASDPASEPPKQINRDLSRVQELLVEQESSVEIPIVVPNIQRLQQDLSALQRAFESQARPNPSLSKEQEFLREVEDKERQENEQKQRRIERARKDAQLAREAKAKAQKAKKEALRMRRAQEQALQKRKQDLTLNLTFPGADKDLLDPSHNRRASYSNLEFTRTANNTSSRSKDQRGSFANEKDKIIEQINELGDRSEYAQGMIQSGMIVGAVQDMYHGTVEIGRALKDLYLSSGGAGWNPSAYLAGAPEATAGIVPPEIQAAALQRTKVRFNAVVEAVRHPIRTAEHVGRDISNRMEEAEKQCKRGDYFAAGKQLSFFPNALSCVGPVGQITRFGFGIAKTGAKEALAFTSTRSFRNPVTFQFDSCRLGSGVFGVPPGSMKIQKPWTNKTRAKKLKAIARNYEDHHIISNRNELTKYHEIFGLANVNIDSRVNKMFLPKKSGIHEKKSVHSGRHYNIVSEALKFKLDELVTRGKANHFTQDQFREGLFKIIKRERKLLRSGKRQLNKNRAPKGRRHSFS